MSAAAPALGAAGSPVGEGPVAGDLLEGSELVRTDRYDVVTVDLDGGRGYPIYIGTGYAEDEGARRRLLFLRVPACRACVRAPPSLSRSKP
jgi:hypothetical protein